MSDDEMRDMVFDAVETHHCLDDGRRRIAIRFSLGGSFTLWELIRKTSWNDDYWDKRGSCYTTAEAREWVGRI
jgi:hypothetical protein